MEKEVTKMTRAEKTAAVKELFKILLEKKNYKRTELIDEAAKLYQERFPGEDTENVNDVKGRMGSVFTIMKEEGEMLVENGVCSLPKTKEAEKPIEAEKPEKPEKPKAKTRKKAEPKAEATEVKEVKEEKPKAKRAKKAAKAEEASQAEEVKAEEPKEGTEEPALSPAPKKRGRKKAEPKTEEAKAETKEELTAETPVEEKLKKKTTRGRKKAEIKAEEPQAKAEETPEKTEEAVEVIKEETPEAKAEVSENKELPQAEEVKPVEKKEEKKKETEASRVFDLSLLLGEKLSPKKGKNDKTETDEKPSEPIVKTREEKAENSLQPSVAKKSEKEENDGGRVELKEQPKPEKPQEKNQEKPQEKTQTKAQEKPVQKPQEARKQEPKPAPAKGRNGRTLKVKQERPLTADEALKEAYLKKLRSLGGDYFEYYSVYLLERYSLKNGRRLEGLKISGGDHDGGIDGEIELTDKFGFRETIYIQAKNWDPEKGNERLWVVGETLLQQFIGACVCRQAKDNKRHCRGIFVTTSRFTPEAKRILDDMSDKIVGYDGNDLFDAAKECSFGLKQKDGVWVLDEDLLSGEKAFFNMF